MVTIEKIKKENVILNIELSQYKLLGLNEELNDASIKDLCYDFQNLKLNQESDRNNDDELELSSREKGKIKITPKWIQDAKSKNSKGKIEETDAGGHEFILRPSFSGH